MLIRGRTGGSKADRLRIGNLDVDVGDGPEELGRWPDSSAEGGEHACFGGGAVFVSLRKWGECRCKGLNSLDGCRQADGSKDG